MFSYILITGLCFAILFYIRAYEEKCEWDQRPLPNRKWVGHYFGALDNDFVIEWTPGEVRITTRYPIAISGDDVSWERKQDCYLYRMTCKEIPTSLKFKNETFYLNDDGTATVYGH